MLFDLNESEVGPILAGKTFDVCIGGAGVAGITLARKLADAGKSVLLLEGGGKEISFESQQLYKGDNVGMPYYDLAACRLRYLGGTSNHWSGRCRPLDAHDFEAKAHIPHSGWPITKQDILPYEQETYDILDIAKFVGDDGDFPQSEGKLGWTSFSFSAPTRFRTKYGDLLERSRNIHLVLNANVVDFTLDNSLRSVTRIVCRNHADPSGKHHFTANRYVVAMGGIENARALLNADGQMPRGLGNANDLVGRFFTEHPHAILGIYWERTPVLRRRFLTPTPALLKGERIANCALKLQGYRQWSTASVEEMLSKSPNPELAYDMRAFRKLIDSMGREWKDVRFSPLKAIWEQIPNPDSRVTLSDRRDKLGLRAPILDWRWKPMDRKTPQVCALEFGKALARGDLGRVKVVDWILDDSIPFPNQEEPGGSHHMGTTRMSDDPQTGVVDRNCRIFGIDNLFVAGSSVFSTGGHANPTFTIVQLTLRLADHLRGTDG